MKKHQRTALTASALLIVAALATGCASTAEPTGMSVSEFISAYPTGSPETTVTVHGKVAQHINEKAFIMSDGSNAILVYSAQGPFLDFHGVAGQTVVVTGDTRLIRAEDPAIDWVGTAPTHVVVNRPGIVAGNVQVLNRDAD